MTLSNINIQILTIDFQLLDILASTHSSTLHQIIYSKISNVVFLSKYKNPSLAFSLLKTPRTFSFALNH